MLIFMDWLPIDLCLHRWSFSLTLGSSAHLAFAGLTHNVYRDLTLACYIPFLATPSPLFYCLRCSVDHFVFLEVSTTSYRRLLFFESPLRPGKGAEQKIKVSRFRLG